MRIRPVSAAIPVLALLFVASAPMQADRGGTAVAQTPVAFSSATPEPGQTPLTFSGATPRPGQIGLLVTATETAPSELVASLRDAGCEPTTLALLTGGTWAIYVVGVLAVVNASFPAALAAITPFFVRCAVTPTPSTPGARPVPCVALVGDPCNITPLGYEGVEGVSIFAADYVTLLDYPGQGSSLTAFTTQGTVLARNPTSGVWTSRGALGFTFPGDAANSASAPSIRYVVGSAIARTTDGWLSWTVLPVPDGAEGLRSVVVHPGDPNTLYVGSQHGVYKSTDAGRTWSHLGNGIDTTGFIVWTVAIDPSNPDVLLAGGENQKDAVEALERGEDARQFPHVPQYFRSADGGASWEPIEPAGYWNPIDIEFVPGKVGSVIMATEGLGVFTSDDAGRSWTHSAVESPNLTAIDFDDSGSSVFIAAIPYAGGPGGVYQSDDDGQTWTGHQLEPPVAIDLEYVGDGTLVVAAFACPETAGNRCAHISSDPDTAYAVYLVKVR